MFNKLIPHQAKIIALILTFILSVLILIQEFYQFKNKLETNLLPSVGVLLDQIAYDTQSQLEFIQFNTIKTYSPYVNNDDFNLNDCLFEVSYNSKTNSFGLNRTQGYSHYSTKDGILIGNGDFSKFTEKERRRLCYVVTSAADNSELIRLTQSESLLNSKFYYVSRYSDYTFIYDSYYSSERMSNFKDSFIRNDFNRIDDPETLFWVSKAHVSAYDQKTIISFVKNITNEYNNVIGFLTRSFEVEDIDAIANRTIWKDNLTSNMLQEGQLVILNHNSEIYRTPATETNTSHHGVFHFIASEKKLNASLFGTFDIEYELPYTNLVYVLLVENVYLLLVPFILYLILYLLSLQLLKSLRESDKQNFDAMTGIYNRQGFEQKVKPKVKKQIAQNKTAHILAIDANKFKQINDKYGHETGDQAIRVIADSAKKITHDEDDVIRLGGDEFLIILYIANNIEFSADEFLHSLNRKISYECKARSIPLFTVTAGHVAYNLTSNASFNVLVKQADKILLDKKWIDKIDVINQGFRNYNIHLSDDESLQKLAIAKRLDFINAEHKLQSELNSDVISVYRHDLNYLMSNYFQLIYADDQDNRLLHRFRMNIVESHHQSDVSMSIFYFLLTKYSGFLGRQIHLTDDEERIYNRLIAYEIYYISSLHMR